MVSLISPAVVLHTLHTYGGVPPVAMKWTHHVAGKVTVAGMIVIGDVVGGVVHAVGKPGVLIGTGTGAATGAVTVIVLLVPMMPSASVAVIVALPALMPIIAPAADTSAIAGVLLDQRYGAAPPEAVAVMVLPTATVVAVVCTWTWRTVTVTLPVLPAPSVMLMVAVPTVTPVVTPVAASTLATPGWVDVHAMGAVAPVAVSATERPTATMGAAGVIGNTAVGVITLMTVL